MLLLSVSPRRKHLTALKFSEDYLPIGAPKSEEKVLLIDSDYCIEQKLTPNMQLSYKEVDKLLLESEKRRAKSYSLWMLSRRNYSSGELNKKLKAKFLPEAADSATCRMVELGLIDDVAYAERLAEVMINEKGVAPKTAAYLMANKGVDLELAKSVLEARQDNPKESIANLIKIKYARKLTLAGGTKKVFDALQRKGFSYSDIRVVMEENGIEL